MRTQENLQDDFPGICFNCPSLSKDRLENAYETMRTSKAMAAIALQAESENRDPNAVQMIRDTAEEMVKDLLPNCEPGPWYVGTEGTPIDGTVHCGKYDGTIVFTGEGRTTVHRSDFPYNQPTNNELWPHAEEYIAGQDAIERAAYAADKATTPPIING